MQDMRAAVDADLTEALALARRTLDPAGVAALADLEALQGRAEGSLAFERRGGQPSHRVELTRVRASGRHRRLPWPVSVNAGEVRYAPDALSVRGLSATLGRSRVTGASADVALDAPVTVRAARGDMVLDLGELYPWLASLEGLRPALKEVRGVTGTAAVRLARASGTLADLEALDFEATVEPDDVRAVLTELPAPLTLPGGRRASRPAQCSSTGSGRRLLDARVTASGRVDGYASPDDRQLDLTLAAGAAGAQSLDWLRTRWKRRPRGPPAPAGHALRGPAALVRRRVERARGARDTPSRRRRARRDRPQLGAGDPPRAAIRAEGCRQRCHRVRPVGTIPRVVRVRGARRRALDRPGHGAAAGGADPAARQPPRPDRSRRAAALDGHGNPDRRGSRRLEPWGVPVSIERVRVDASGDAMTIRDGIVKVAGQRVSVGGGVAVRPETFAVNLRVTADRIDAGQLLQAHPGADRSQPSKRSVWDVPVEGRVAIGAKSIVVGERVVESIAGTVRLAPKQAVVELTKASLCGVSVPLDATLTPGGATVSGRIAERARRSTPSCPASWVAIWSRRGGSTPAEYAASGPLGELAPRLGGTFRATGRGGRIQYAKLGPKILALAPVAERMEPEHTAQVASRGFDFTRVAALGTLDAGRVRLERFTLDSWVLGLGLTGEIDLAEGQLGLRGVVAPFGNVTGALRRVPVVGRLFGARIVGVPFSVSGDWHDPRVIPLGPEAIAGSFVDLLGRALNAPIRLLSPLIPSRERAP